MTGLTLKAIAKAVNGQLFCDEKLENQEIQGVVMDNRLVEKDYLFVSIKGNRVDGHSFIEDSYERGALCVFSEKVLENNNKPYILVDSSTDALRSLASYYRSIMDIKIVGISGSVGKTSTKEFIAAVLGKKFNVLKTAGNYNNEIGLPLTILKIKDEHQIAVLEMGISDFGEMDVLAKIARPDVCVLTNIGPCHLEALGDLDGVLRAKSEMFNYADSNTFVVLNGDDEKLKTISNIKENKPVFYGKNQYNNYIANDIKSNGIEGTEFVLLSSGNEFKVSIPIPGEHMVMNALAAFAVGKHFDMSEEDIITGLSEIQPVGGRVNVIKKNGYTIIDDCYNANPVSMKASLDVIVNANTRKVAILGDMFELGENEKQMHYEVGKYAGAKNIDMIVCIGNLTKNLYDGVKETDYKGELVHFETVDDFVNKYSTVINESDTVLLKASHSMEFDKILEELTKDK